MKKEEKGLKALGGGMQGWIAEKKTERKRDRYIRREKTGGRKESGAKDMFSFNCQVGFMQTFEMPLKCELAVSIMHLQMDQRCSLCDI